MNSNNLVIYLKLFLYFTITILTGFLVQLDSLNLDDIYNIPLGVWVKTGIKALIPSLLSIRAYLDTSFSNFNLPPIALNSNKEIK